MGVDREADEAPQSGETPRTNKKYILESVEWVTEALAVMTSNDFLSPGSRPSVNAEVSPRQANFDVFFILRGFAAGRGNH